jgi:PPP family 3-phenylpropionic acid transporter
MALSAAAPIMALTEPLHGLSFALLHLAAMAVIARTVPAASAALAESAYGALGVGAATAVLSFASGILFSRLGAASFWVMGALAALALPFVFALPSADDKTSLGVEYASDRVE